MMKHFFIGLPLSEEARRGVTKIVKELSKKHWPVRWEPVEKWHVTLVFLRKVANASKVDEVVESITQNQQPFWVGFNGLGQFPRLSRLKQKERLSGRIAKPVKVLPRDSVVPNVIWLGIKGEVYRLSKLQKELRYMLSSTGCEVEQRAFFPHLTLGRVLPNATYAQKREIAKEIAKMSVWEIPQEWRVDRVRIYESVLLPEGSKYQTLNEVKLADEGI